MRFSELFICAPLVVGLTLCLAPARAQSCFVCDEVVELDQARADCLMSRYDEFETRLSASQKGRVEIDFSSCGAHPSSNDGVKERGFGTSSISPGDILAVELRNSYILDRPSLNCLRQTLSDRTIPIDPTLRIDLAQCSR